MTMNRIACVTLALAAASLPAGAQEAAGVHFTGSGFATFAVGKMLGGNTANVGDYNCPCYTADYAQAGVYDGRNGLQWKPDSKLGLQGTAALAGDRLSLTTQVVARGARDGKADLEWLYGSYKLNDEVTLQVGRKRLPMFYYSEIQDVGFALPWTHLPPQLYGWEVVNYNGANLMVQHAFGAWNATLNVMAGGETFKDSGYWKLYNGRQSRTDVKWKNIVGGDLTLSKDWLETRLVFIQSDTQTRISDKGVWDAATQSYDPTFADADWNPQPPYKQRISGIAVNADYADWLVRTELIRIDHPGANWRDYASIIGIGRRFGKWQPMVTHSRYWGKAIVDRWDTPPDPSALEGHYSLAFTLRYDLTSSSALKVQYDRQVDQSGPNFSIGNNGTPYGNARLLTVSYDVVF